LAGGTFGFVYTILQGDMDLDNRTTGLDITPFINALTNPSLNPNEVRMADIQGDGYANGLDVTPFVGQVGLDYRDLVEDDLVGNFDTDYDIDATDQATFMTYYNAGNSNADIDGISGVTSDDLAAFTAMLNFFAGLNLSVVA
jgi:hypothetical protein